MPGNRFPPLTVWISTNNSKVFRRNATLSPPYHDLAKKTYAGISGWGLTLVVINYSNDRKLHKDLYTTDPLLNMLSANEESNP